MQYIKRWWKDSSKYVSTLIHKFSLNQSTETQVNIYFPLLKIKGIILLYKPKISSVLELVKEQRRQFW